MIDMRDVEKKIGDKWLLLSGIDKLNRGDTFRMFEPTGEPVKDKQGNTIFLALSNPYWSDNYNTWMIDIDSVNTVH